ncbi:phosphatase PAP2 family protein [Candidatus Woesearchaeota archaeon]|nr:phosphatase PAP2 family protein [Candidatus Woesearchaeota archaeon]
MDTDTHQASAPIGAIAKMKKSIIAAIIYATLFLALIISPFIEADAVRFFAENQDQILAHAAQWISHIGSTAAVLIAATCLLFWKNKKREWIPALWGSVLLTSVTVHALKFAVQRPRPMGNILFVPLMGWISYSFPSGHAAVASAAAPILCRGFPRLRWLWIMFPLMMALSRLYQNLHYLSDVAAGITIGLTFGLLTVMFEDRYKLFEKVKIWKKSSR